MRNAFVRLRGITWDGLSLCGAGLNHAALHGASLPSASLLTITYPLLSGSLSISYLSMLSFMSFVSRHRPIGHVLKLKIDRSNLCACRVFALVQPERVRELHHAALHDLRDHAG